MKTTTEYSAVTEAEKNLYVGRHRAKYDGLARMNDVLRKNSTPVPPRHAKEVAA